MTAKKLVAKIIRKKGMLYFVDKEGRVWEKELNKGRSKKTLEKMRLAREKKLAEKYF
ncbi:hypothetical protein LCGC14_2724950 [marine sediment metagenome]|uniref:Uncharacterized protein n=1 Tax=marine sediment metagenome TaxID=412755 RepID=A0A0F8Z925_9ZZZZ